MYITYQIYNQRTSFLPQPYTYAKDASLGNINVDLFCGMNIAIHRGLLVGPKGVFNNNVMGGA